MEEEGRGLARVEREERGLRDDVDCLAGINLPPDMDLSSLKSSFNHSYFIKRVPL